MGELAKKRLEARPPDVEARVSRVLEMVALTLDQPHFQQAATTFATRLANEFDCARVSVGFLRGRFVTVRALSHSASHAVKTALLRTISAAMEEAIDQDRALVCPGKGMANLAHRRVLEQNRDTGVCSIPLVDNGRTVGAITLERNNGLPFDPATVDLCMHIANLAAPVLELKRRNDTWPLVRMLQSVGSLLQHLFGPRFVKLKLGALLLTLLTLYLGLATATWRVTADASLQGTVQRAVVAPIDGFILDSGLRAGDAVKQGQVMGRLDDRELMLEQQKLVSEKARHSGEYRSAMADHDRAQVSILSARIRQADARLQLINRQLERMQITAPLDGIIVSGDLTQSLGSPVTRGDVLFEVAPLDAYRLVLQVDERDMRNLQAGQQGKLKLSGLPHRPLNFAVTRITPVSEPNEQGNFYRVEATLHDVPAMLRPGMEGVGKIEIGERRLLWIWTHRMVEWLKLQAWSWLP